MPTQPRWREEERWEGGASGAEDSQADHSSNSDYASHSSGAVSPVFEPAEVSSGGPWEALPPTVDEVKPIKAEMSPQKSTLPFGAAWGTEAGAIDALAMLAVMARA